MERDSSSRPWQQWRVNLRAMQRRVKDRLRIASFGTSTRAHGHPHILSRQIRGGKAVAVYAQATGLVGAARVFKDNVIFSNALHSVADQLRSTLNLGPSAARATSAMASPPHPIVDNAANPSLINRSLDDDSAETNYTAVFGENSQAVRLLQKVALPVIGNICHAFMHGFNQTEVYGAEKLIEAVAHRPNGQALITVSNHVASIDDPLVLAAVLPPHVLLDANALRWTLCATDRCFTNRATSAFFRCVKVLPVGRGGGVHQKGIDWAVERLKRGDWVHMFPEGTRSRDGGKTIQTAKRGIGRLVLDSGEEPLVIPFVHSGMEQVMPIGRKFPAIRKKVVVLVGDPIVVDDLIEKYERTELSKAVVYEAIAFRVGQRLKILKDELDQLVLSNAKVSSGQVAEAFNNQRASAMEYVPNNQRHYSDQLNSSEEQGPRKVSLGALEEMWLSESRLLAGAHLSSLQEGVVTRLQRFKDRASFVGFAARGLLRQG